VIRALLVAALGALALAGPAQAAADDLKEVRRDQFSPRMLELGLTTPALPAETNVRVLLPEGYAADPARRYPVLYLLHGCCDFDVPGSRAWTTHGEAEQATAGLPLIVVMPDGGRGGMYSDWLSAGTQGRFAWETYHLEQLVPFVDREFRTRASREGRAIAGLSMGGFGAMKYASRHPDRFVAAASFSGIPDSNVNEGLIHGALPNMDGGTPASVWGLRATDELRWRSQNPWDLAENLHGLQLGVRTGNGEPGPLDGGGLPFDPVEAQAHQGSLSFHERLAALGIGHTWDDYGPGTHSWPYWARSLRDTLVEQMRVLTDPPAPPAQVTYRTAEPAFEIFGWRVAFAREELAWARLAGAGAAGFTLEGEGAAEVRTPPAYRPGSAATVTVNGARSTLTADGDGRLTIPVVAPAEVRIAAPAARLRTACSSRRAFTVTLPRGLRGARATLGGRRVPVRGRRVRVDLRGHPRGTVRLVVRARGVRLVRRYRTCAPQP
jgi:S-formylglutathione hydrolase FrmB